MSHLSVIVTDGGPVALRVQGVVADWARAGLVDESAWVCLGDVTPTAGPPKVMTTVVGPEGTRVADLFHTVGVRRLDTVRLVVAQFIVADDGQSPELPELGRTLAELLAYTLPHPDSDEGSQKTELRKTNVLIPASWITGITLDALLPGWDANAVVAAEDRPNLDRASIFVREGDGGNYTGHAAAAISSVAALWTGIDGGCLDVLETDSTEMDTDVAVVRQAVRAIVRNNEIQNLADAACAYVVNDPSAPATMVEWARPALEPDRVVDSVLMETMESGDWATQEPTRGQAPSQVEKRFGAAFLDAAKFNVRLIGLGLRGMVLLVRRALEYVATGAILGQRADQVVRFRPTSTPRVFRESQEKLDALPEEMRRRMLIAEGGSVAAPSATTWVSLRRSCFGLADGSSLPGEYEVPEIAGKPQILPPSSIVPDPADSFETMDGVMIRACDARTATEYLAQLRADAGEPPPDGGEADLDEADSDTGGDEAQREAERKRAKDEIVALESWVDARKHTLAWRIFDGVTTRAAQKSVEADRAHADAIAPALLPIERLRRAQRRLIIAWTILGIIFTGVCVYLWRDQRDQMTTSDFVVAIAEVFLALLLLGLLGNHLFYRAVHHFEWRVDQTLAGRRITAERYVVAQRESRRLQLLASAFNAWAEIIGTVLHHPWTSTPAASPPSAVDGVGHLPASVAVAIPPGHTFDISPVVMARAIQVLTPRGWASQLFDRGVDTYESNVRSSRDSGHLAADLDTLNSPTSPLGLLWHFFCRGDASRFATANARERIEKALDDGALELPPRSVRRIGEYTDDQNVTDVEYFAGVLHPAIPFVGDLWTPTGLLRHKNVPDQSVAWMPRAAGTGQVRSVDRLPATENLAMRVDLSRRCVTSDLRAFALESKLSEPLPVSRPEDAVDSDVDW